jgi:hypothetical protein
MGDGSAPWRQSLRSLTRVQEQLRPKNERDYWASPAGAGSCGVLQIDRGRQGRCLAWGFRTLAEAELLAALANVIAAGEQQPDPTPPTTVYVAITRPPCLLACRASPHALEVPEDFPLGTDAAALDRLQLVFDAVFMTPVDEARRAILRPLQKLCRSFIAAAGKTAAPAPWTVKECRALLDSALSHCFRTAAVAPVASKVSLSRMQLEALEAAALQQIPPLREFHRATALLKAFGPPFARILLQAQDLARGLPLSMLQPRSAPLYREDTPAELRDGSDDSVDDAGGTNKNSDDDDDDDDEDDDDDDDDEEEEEDGEDEDSS